MKIFTIILTFTSFIYADVRSFSFENDAIFKTDKYYTNSISYSWLSSKNTNDQRIYDNSFYNFINNIPFQKEKKNQSIQLGFEHFLFTPDDIEKTEKIKDDIPYAGVAELQLSIYRWEEKYFHQFGLSLSLVGPSALGEEVQNTMHDMIGARHANGWDNQLDDSLNIGINYSYGEKFYTKYFDNNSKFEVINQIRFDLGTDIRGIIGGTNFRYGYNIPNNFATIGKTIGANQNYALNLDSKKNKKFGYSISYGIFYNYVDYFYITDHDKSYTINPINNLFGKILGFDFYYKDYSLNIFLKEEIFLSKKKHSQKWGTFSIKKVF